jgi:hypothetical protein
MKRQPPQIPKDAPAGTVWFGGPIGWFRISLRITADDLNPNFVTDLFGVAPDYAQTKDEPLLRPDGTVKGLPKFGAWEIELTPRRTDEWDIEEVARLLLARLPTEIEIWRSIPTSAKVRLSFGISLESFNQGFALDPDFCRYVADRNIRLDFDVYGQKKNDPK